MVRTGVRFPASEPNPGNCGEYDQEEQYKQKLQELETSGRLRTPHEIR
jgi:hypothetical protein